MNEVANKVRLLDRRAQPKVSVIIPVYNTEKYLARCLDSVISQTERDIEIICVNDGSTDGSTAILSAYAAKDPRIRIITQENKRQGAARNAGLDIATGEYVMFVDSDDVLHKMALSQFLVVAERSHAKIVANRRLDVLPVAEGAPGDMPTRFRLRGNALADFVHDRRIFSSVFNKLYRRSIIGDIRFMEGVVFEDWPFLVKVFAQADAFATIECPLYFYNMENPSTIRSPFNAFKVRSYLKGICNLAETFGRDPAYTHVQRRMAVAMRMMIRNVTQRGDSESCRVAADGLRSLFDMGVIAPRHLDLKTRFRIWVLKRNFK